jgi:cell division protein FtsL
MATFYDRLIATVAPRGHSAAPIRRVADEYRLRAIPNEDVYLYVKSIDNSRVVRKADPQAGTAKWRLILGSCTAALLVVALLLPGAYSMLAGRDLRRLEGERDALKVELRLLDAEQARLVNPQRIQELAEKLRYVDPPPDKVIYLQPKDQSLAMNGR